MQVIVETSWGEIGIEANDRAIVRLFLPGCIPDGFAPIPIISPLLQNAAREIHEYFASQRETFTLPLEPAGRDFMQSAWRQLLAIPYGQLRTYGDVAKALANPGASRAVGMACRINPIPLLIPCHRVVGAGNKLTGFSGGGIDVKRRLIEHEMGGLFARKRIQPAL